MPARLWAGAGKASMPKPKRKSSCSLGGRILSLMALGEKAAFCGSVKRKVSPPEPDQRGNGSACIAIFRINSGFTCKESHGDILLYAAARCRRGKSQKGFKAAFEKNHQLQAAGVPRISSCISQKERRRGKLSEDFYPRGVSAAFLPRQRSSHAADIMAAPNRQQPPSRNFCSSVRLSSSLRLLTAGGERNCPTWLELQ